MGHYRCPLTSDELKTEKVLRSGKNRGNDAQPWAMALGPASRHREARSVGGSANPFENPWQAFQVMRNVF
jgi:hypothetical protein